MNSQKHNQAAFMREAIRLSIENVESGRAAAIQFDDQFIYQEIELPLSRRTLPTEQLLREEAQVAFGKRQASALKIEY